MHDAAPVLDKVREGDEDPATEQEFQVLGDAKTHRRRSMEARLAVDSHQLHRLHQHGSQDACHPPVAEHVCHHGFCQAGVIQMVLSCARSLSGPNNM